MGTYWVLDRYREKVSPTTVDEVDRRHALSVISSAIENHKLRKRKGKMRASQLLSFGLRCFVDGMLS